MPTGVGQAIVLPVVIRVHIPQVRERSEIGRDGLFARDEDSTIPLMPAFFSILQASEEGPDDVPATLENSAHLLLLFGLIVLDSLLRDHG
ncbi:MAG: hypothetical protein NW700_20850 [Nitrospiraceae bacterium]